MAEQDERGFGVRAGGAQAANARPAAGGELDDLGRDARIVEHLGAVARGRRLAAGRVAARGHVRATVRWVDRWDPDERAQVLDARVEIEMRPKVVGHVAEGSAGGGGRKASIAAHATRGMSAASSMPAEMSIRVHSSAAPSAPPTMPMVEAALMIPNVRLR